MTGALALFLLGPQPLWAQGGCGSVCIPLEVLGPESTHMSRHGFRVLVTSEYGKFDNFLVGDDDISNPGGNEAIISESSVFLDYGAWNRVALSLAVPYVRKEQMTNRFGKRVAEGVGDLVLFGRYEVLAPAVGSKPSLSLGLGLKFPTGSIGEPGGGQAQLPPPFQVGSGAYDLVPTVSYFQAFSRFSLFGNSFARLPVESNKLGYRFGRELEVHFGAIIPLPIWKRRLELLVSADYLNGDHDEDNESILPGRLRDGTKVLNTGGEFLSLTPGFRLRLTGELTMQIRAFIPVVEDWNGLASRNVGQVAPDLQTQLTLTYIVR